MSVRISFQGSSSDINPSDNPMKRAIEHVMEAVSNCKKAEHVDEAHIVFAMSPFDLEQLYRRDQLYCVLTHEAQPYDPQYATLNVFVAPVTQAVVNALKLVQLATEKIERGELLIELPPPPEANESEHRNILVVDDTALHRWSAHAIGMNTTIAAGYQEAIAMLERDIFDVVLTDLELPMSSHMLGSGFVLGKPEPYGYAIAMEAARNGCKKIAIVTDGNHHSGPHQATFDRFIQAPIKIEGATLLMQFASTVDDAKCWRTSLKRLDDCCK